MAERRNDDRDEGAAPPPGEGDSLDDASKEAVREIERRGDGAGYSGAGDIG